jgi:hypothetical protein
MAELKARGVPSSVRRGVGGAAGETLKRTGAAAQGAGNALERAGGGGDQRTVGEELREIVREAALEVLVPVARRATTQAAKYAIRRGPQLARDTIAPRLADTLGGAIEEAGGPGAFAQRMVSSVSDARTGMLEKVGIGGESQSRPWRERRLPVEESIDLVVPLETAYDRFPEFEEYAKFMSRGEMVDERPDERITWKRTDGVDASAVVTFHRLSDRLTRVMVTYDHQPQGPLGKAASLFSTSRRGLLADLMRFKAFVEMSEEDTEAPEEEPAGRYEEKSPPAPSRPVRRRPAARRRQTARS